MRDNNFNRTDSSMRKKRPGRSDFSSGRRDRFPSRSPSPFNRSGNDDRERSRGRSFDRSGQGRPFGRSPSRLPILSVKIINNGQIPQYMTPDASGMDLYSNQDVIIEQGKIGTVTTGIFVKSVPARTVISLRSRSSLGSKGLLLLSPTLITEEYKNTEIIISFLNLSKESFEVKKGHRICQMIFNISDRIGLEIAEDLSNTQRNTSGFGSTGE